MNRNQYNSLHHELAAPELSGPAAERVSALLAGVDDWSRFLHDLEMNGLAAMLLKHDCDHGLGLPYHAVLSLKALAFRHRGSADARYQAISELLPALDRAGCRVLFLKGMALAPQIYDSMELRPMRDLDILVRRGDRDKAAEVIRGLGYELPGRHPDKYNRDSHQLPNAAKRVGGFKISVELHLDAVERDAPGHLVMENVDSTRKVRWRDLEFETLDHPQMLEQLCLHLAGRHPGSRLKLINVTDIVLYSERHIDEIDWEHMKNQSPRVINTLRCLHLVIPLSEALQDKLGGVRDVQVERVGEIMPNLRDVIRREATLKRRFRALFLPSDWWLYLNYSVPPGQPLRSVKLWRHPTALVPFFGRRILSRLLGG